MKTFSTSVLTNLKLVFGRQERSKTFTRIYKLQFKFFHLRLYNVLNFVYLQEQR